MSPLVLSLFVVGYSIGVGAFVLIKSQRVKKRTGHGLTALSCMVTGIAFALLPYLPMAVLEAVVTAWQAYIWWTGGGGDGTKRRLRKFASRFQGTRRTAPAGGAA